MREVTIQDDVYRYLETAEDVDSIPNLPALIDSVLAWWEDKKTLPTEEFIDKFCTYSKYEIDNYLDPAAKRVMSIARKRKREIEEWGS